MTDIEKVIKGLEDIQKHLDTGYSCAVRWDSKLILDALTLLKEQQPRKTKEEVLLAIIGKQSYVDIEKFKQLEELNDEYFNGILDAIRAVEKLFDERKDEHS